MDTLLRWPGRDVDFFFIRDFFFQTATVFFNRGFLFHPRLFFFIRDFFYPRVLRAKIDGFTVTEAQPRSQGLFPQAREKALGTRLADAILVVGQTQQNLQ